MDVLKQIKELEKKAKLADYWKDRYKALCNEVETVSMELNALLNIKSNKKKKLNITQKTSKDIAEDIYQKEMIAKNRQIDVELINNYLSEAGKDITTTNQYCIRNELKGKRGVEIAKIGKNLIFFLRKVPTQEDTTEFISQHGGTFKVDRKQEA